MAAPTNNRLLPTTFLATLVLAIVAGAPAAPVEPPKPAKESAR